MEVALNNEIDSHEIYQNSKEILQNHLTNEIFIALVGHVGSGISFVADRLKNALQEENHGFKVKIIKASSILTTNKDYSSSNHSMSKHQRTILYQNLGDELRNKSGNAAIAQGVISLIRKQRALFQKMDITDDTAAIVPNGEKHAYIIDSLKHPDEVELLRHVYGEAFSLIGVVCFDETRVSRLSDKYFQKKSNRISKDEKDHINKVMDRDADDSLDKSGQHVTDTFWESDYFLNNTVSKDSEIEFTLYDDLGRFVDIVTNSQIVRPTLDETGMHIAFSSQLRSSCLSKQVGSSILDDEGNLLVTGCNEVPKAGGGVYGEIFNDKKLKKESINDDRCFICNKYCSSNKEQNRIAKKLLDAFPEIKNNNLQENDIIMKLRKLGLGSLLEFSRAVHAEMDSITSAARKGISLKGARMFVTTYPCHYCSRHIIASGISEVQFIEPYPKSLAMNLHSDAITVTTKEKGKKVLFTPFVGVAPRMYEKAFRKVNELKNKITGDLNIDSNSRNKWGTYKVSYSTLEFELSPRD